jgi:hypothetical protein
MPNIRSSEPLFALALERIHWRSAIDGDRGGKTYFGSTKKVSNALPHDMTEKKKSDLTEQNEEGSVQLGDGKGTEHP